MQLRHVLAVVDFSCDAGTHAAWRAAHLAWAHGAELCLWTQVELADGSPSSRFGATAPPARARADLLHLAGRILDARGIRPAVVVGVGADGRDTFRACARRADLVVLPEHTKTAQRTVTEHGVPVLMARLQPASAHRSAMVIHQPGHASLASLLGSVQWLCKPEGVRAFSALDRRSMRHLRASDASVGTIQALSQLAHHRAHEALQAELIRAGLRRDQGTVLDNTSATRLAQEQARSGASVLVVGQRQRPAWLELLWPGLARRLTAQAPCDVLIVPDRLPTAKEARWSLGAGRRCAALSEEG